MFPFLKSMPKMFTVKKLYLFLAILIILVVFRIIVSTTSKEEKLQKSDVLKMDSIIKNHFSGTYKWEQMGTSYELTLNMRESDCRYFRRRYCFVERLLYKMSNYMDRINFIKIKVTSISEPKMLVATYSFNKSDILILKNWPQKDPIGFYFKSLITVMDNNKYEEFALVASMLSQSIEEEKKLNTFDPDLAYYIDKLTNEMYGVTKGFRQRQIMESFYEITVNPKIKTKYIKSEDILKFINYADTIYYLKKYPNEMKMLLDKSQIPNR